MKKFILPLILILILSLVQLAFADSPLTVYSSTSDGYMTLEGVDWDTVHDATEGEVIDDDPVFSIATLTITGEFAVCERAFVFFNTSSIPANAIIDSATLSLYGMADSPDTDFNIVIQNGQTTYPHDPLVVGDYLYTHYSGNGGQISTSGFKTNDYNVITITELDWIQKGDGAVTKLALLSSLDIGNNPPEFEENVILIWTAEEEEVGERRPRLIVNYTAAAPTVGNVSINSDADSITLNEGTTTNVVCTYNATNTNGWTDITTTTAKLYLTSVGAGAADDNDNHYTLSGARDDYCTSTGANTGNCTTTFSVYYYADPGEWTCQATVFDSQSASSTATDTISMSETQYLDVSTTTLDYSEVNVGSTSTGNHIITVSNTGNTAIDVKISGTDMSCTTHGSIPVGNQEYAKSNFSHGEGTDLTDTPTDWNLDLPKPTSSTPTVEADTYWQVSVPTGTEGTCTGTNTFEARSAL